jgi:hypothetical protein
MEKEIFDKSRINMDVILMKGMILPICLFLLAGLGCGFSSDLTSL